MKARFTPKQGQYLAFIHYYTRLNDCPPAEADMQCYFRVTPPTVHQMVLTLEARGLIQRTPGRARSIRLMIRSEDLPALNKRLTSTKLEKRSGIPNKRVGRGTMPY